MTTKHNGKHVFTGEVELESTLAQTGNQTITGNLSVSGTTTTGSPLTIGTLTLTDNTTKLTCSSAIEATGQLLASGLASCTYLVETTAAVSVADTTYTVAGGVHIVNCSSTGAGGPYAITLGANNGVNHTVTVYCSAYDTSSFTIASAEGTTTLDAADESATFIYTGSEWRCISFLGTTGPA